MTIGPLANWERVPLGIWWLDAWLDRLETSVRAVADRVLPPAKMDERSAPPQPRWLLIAAVVLMALLVAKSARAQSLPDSDRYPLLDQRVPVGVWSDWVRTAGRINGVEFQPVRVELPAGGHVRWFAGSRETGIEGPEAAIAVGHVYRLRLSGFADFPGLELYPSVELLDRLHPPAGHAERFPLPLTFTEEEIDAVASGQMLTKVVYLEQPQFAAPFELTPATSIRTLNGRANLIAEADKAGRPMAIIRLGSRQPGPRDDHGTFFGSGSPILPLAKHANAADSSSIQQAVTRSAAQPRIDLASFSESDQAAKPVTAPTHLAEQFPDEYLIDGGDRGQPVHFDGPGINGVETEDTIAEFQDHRGRRRVKATNRVAVFAPRFAAVRTIGGLAESFNVQRLTTHFDQLQGAKLRHKVGTRDHVQRDRLQGVRMRSRPSGVLSETNAADAVVSKRLAQHSKLLNLFEAARFLESGTIGQAELAVIQKSARAAHTFSRELNPIVMGNITTGQEVYAMFKVAELVGIEEREKKNGRLRIVKLADRDAAQPGDIITFTIRYDNLGDQELRFVRIIDNLTPRLEYVDESVESDREGSIHVDDNGEGSQVLRIELDQPLPGRTGGVISFQAQVR